MGTRRHHECQLSLLVQGRRYVFSHGYKMAITYACDCVWLCVGISGQNSFKEERMYNQGKIEFFLKKNGKTINCYNSTG